MSHARKLLWWSAFALALWGMSFGFWYAVLVEHQTLDGLGAHLATAFMHAAARDLPAAHASLASYTATEFVYVRQVDVHSHWIGLALLLFVLGIGFDRLAIARRQQDYLAVALCAGSAIFPLGVMLQTMIRGPLPDVLAIIGAAMVIVALAVVALGFARPSTHPRA
jgi:dipeptide/tripeptide permease